MEEGRSSPTERKVLIIGGGLVAVCATVLFCFDPAQYHFYPTCIFHQATGLLCPGCGSLRALHQLLHGHVLTAFRFNPLLVVALPSLACFGLLYIVGKHRFTARRTWFNLSWLWAVGIIFLVVSIWRNLPGAPTLIRPPS